MSGAGVKSRPARAARSRRNARRKPSLSKMPCQVVPGPAPASQPSRKVRAAVRGDHPVVDLVPVTGRRARPTAGQRLGAANLTVAGSSPRPVTSRAALHVVDDRRGRASGSRRRRRAPGRPRAAWSAMATSRPGSRSQARSATVARVPGRTTRSASVQLGRAGDESGRRRRARRPGRRRRCGCSSGAAGTTATRRTSVAERRPRGTRPASPGRPSPRRPAEAVPPRAARRAWDGR